MSFSVDVRDDTGAGFQPQISLLLFRQQHPENTPTSADTWLLVPTAILVSLLKCRRQVLRPNKAAVQLFRGDHIAARFLALLHVLHMLPEPLRDRPPTPTPYVIDLISPCPRFQNLSLSARQFGTTCARAENDNL